MTHSHPTRRALRLALSGVLVVLGLLVHAQPAGYPQAPQVHAGDLAVQLDDLAALPLPDSLTGRLSRVTAMRFEPGNQSHFASRAFVADLRRYLFILDLPTKVFTTYIDFARVFGRFADGSSYGSGLTSVAFHPEYALNGKLYTVHTEGATRTESLVPSNESLPGLDVSGYMPSDSIDPPDGVVSKHAVLIEWTDTDLTNTTFEGTAREVLRVGFSNGNHSIADILFNPGAHPGDPDFANLYLAVGDGGAGQQEDQDNAIPQRLDALPGKILRITPDVDLRPDDLLAASGRYRIPSTGGDPNPFVDIELPGRKAEIFAYGLRNPQRMSWDPVSGTLIVADIGLFSWEELNVIHKGRNYGYSQREGPERLFVGGANDGHTGGQTTPTSPHPEPDALTVAGVPAPVAPRYPAAAYSHHDGDAIAGGFVYRGTLIPQLYGTYVFGDITTARVFYVDLDDLLAADDDDRTTLATIRELQILHDDPSDAPDRGVVPTRLFDIVANQYARRGGTASNGARLPQAGGHLSDADDTHGVPYGGGRADIRFAEDRDGELYILSKSDGMIRQLVASRTGVTSTALTSTPNPSPTGTPVTLRASVTASVVPVGSVEFFEGGVPLGTAPVVEGGATLPVSGLAAGTHVFTARFTPADQALLESVGGVTHAVEQPDLVSALDLLPTAVAPGARLNFSETTSNTGLAAAGASTTRYLLSLDTADGGDIALATRAIAGLAPGEQSAGALSTTVPASTALGPYHVIACADATSTVGESNETNNCVASTTTVSVTRADLVSTSASTAAQSVAPGGTVTVADTVQNIGGVASVSTVTRFYLSVDAMRSADDRVAGSRSVAALAAGASSFKAATTLTVPAATPLGLYLLIACADDPTKNVELSEANNCTAAPGQLRVGRADLVVTAIANPPSSIAPGKTFSVTATTTNAGSATSGSSTTRFYFSLDAWKDGADVLLTGSISVAALVPGQMASASRTVTVPTTLPDGNYRLLACADDTGKTVELDEGNNCRASGTSVLAGRPDLTQTAVTNPPTTVAAGLKFTVTDTAANVGAIASATTATRYYLSRDALRSSDDVAVTGARSVPALAPGAVSTGATLVTVPTLAAGTYYLVACADANAVAVELREDNNCVTSVTSTSVP